MTVDRIRGSITALITPMQADGGVDEDRYAAFMDWQITEGTQGLVPMGTSPCVPSVICQSIKAA